MKTQVSAFCTKRYFFYLQTQKLVRQKQLEIEDFCVYWDTECEMLGNLPASQIQVRLPDAYRCCCSSPRHAALFARVRTFPYNCTGGNDRVHAEP